MMLRTWFRTIMLAALAVAAVAQTAPETIPEASVPPEVSKALRDRVSQFFQYHVGSVNRRAFDLVAEDTKDYYFSSQKVTFSDFTLDKLAFSKDQTQAVVWAHATRQWEIQGQTATVNSEVVTTWKQEEGKWVWFLDVKGLWATPMGASNFAATQAAQQKNVVNADLVYQKPDGTIDLPADFSSPQNLAAQSAAILQKSGIDKTEVSLTFGVPAKQQITFHNGMNGAVMVELLGAPSGIPGLQVILEKQNVGAREDSAIRFQYDPPANEPVPDFATRSYTLNLLMQPFNQIFPVKLTINQSPAK